MLYEVTVKPGSKKGPLLIADGNHLTIYLREKPIDGSSHFKVAKTCIEIRSGQSNRKKLIEIPIDSENM